MKVLLLGATGNLGSRLLPALLAHNHTLTVYVRSAQKLRTLFPASITDRLTIMTGDAEDTSAIRRAIVDSRSEAVVNASGGIAFWFWQAHKHQGIIHAVADAVVSASEELARPIRCWFVSGTPALGIPGTNDIKIGR